MKRNEIIELNGVEYTLELNRDSAVQIEKYTNTQKTMQIITAPLVEYVEEIEENENPFENVVDIEKMQEKAQEKIEALNKMITRAFWIWLYPNHKLNINQVKELLQPYLEDDGEKFSFINQKYAEYLELSTEISDKYIEEQKNLKAQVNK